MKFPRGARAQAGEVSHPAPYSGASPPASAAATAVQEAPPGAAVSHALAPPEGMPRQPRFTPKPGAPVLPAPVAPVRTRPVRAVPAPAAPTPARPGPAARLASPRPAKPVPHTRMKPVSAGPAQQIDERQQKTARALI